MATGPHIGMRTPWGKADLVQKLADGVWQVGTPSHGGLKLSTAVNNKIPEPVRAKGGWYEEDLQYLWVVACFPELVESGIMKGTIEQAHATLKNWFPDEYEAVIHETVAPEQSRVRQRKLFAEQHPNDWVVAAAWGDWHEKVPKGMVGVLCRQAKYKGQRGPERWFIVPDEDYSSEALINIIGDFTCEPSPSPNAPYQEIPPLQ